jgi:phosphoenolpyruvate synthase/pyruvate phosphate dikinase
MILTFGDVNATHLSNSGGKGASLAKLFQGGFAVPPGVIVPASAYAEFAGRNADLRTRIDALDYSSPDALVVQCSELRRLMTRLPLPADLEATLREAVPPLLAEGPVAVRSSSTMEDLAGAAFAGQHDTFLGIRTIEDVLDRVRRCFASLWEDRAAHYRHARGFEQHRATMAVVIQALVESEVAGVAFTMNPISGSIGQIVINSSYGLGETVVSGAGDVDQFVLDKKSGAIVEQSIGDKEKMIVAGGHGTTDVELDDVQRHNASLDAQQLEALRQLLTGVERFYGFPQDVEWAFARGQLFLLQSRPITRFPARWTRGESAERFPNVITLLTWDFVCEGFHASLEHSLRLMGLPAFDDHWFELFDNYVYGNETAVRLFTAGQQVAFDSLDGLRNLLPVIRDRYQWVVQLPVAWARDLDWYLLRLGALSAVDLEPLNEEQLWRNIAAINAAGSRYFLPNIAISITHGIVHRMLYQLVTMLVGPQEGPSLYDSLTCFCETKTNVVNNDLHRLAELVREDRALASLLSRMDRAAIWREEKLRAFPRFAESFDAFLANHGHREVDFDTYVPTWSGQPWVVLENIRLLAGREDLPDPAAREIALRERQQNAERRLNDLVPEDLRYFTLELVRLARAYTALDDLEHYETTRLSIPFRRAIVELGARLKTGGILGAADDIFFLRKQTIERLIAGELTAGEVEQEATKNKSAYEANRQRTPSFVLNEEPEETPNADAFRGLPGSPGIAEGTVFRLHGVEDFGRFPPGSVLVARTTNPAWTPLFHTSCAVITESGGPLSHGAVTAREVGIPAVMSVRGALHLLPDGARVRVNGTLGTVTILE